jgi:8-hydroxy-5-deazaflavin:NADPH oxidoreductase
MRVGVLGSGIVGRTIAGKVASLDHEVVLGTRDVRLTTERPAGPNDAESFADWHGANAAVIVAPYAEAASHGEIVVHATNGAGALEALARAGQDNLDDKILVDVSNPLDFSAGFPPTLAVSNTDSLGEQIQRTFPRTRVVKTLNTVQAAVMVDPASVGGGDHHVFVSGDDQGAKDRVAELLRDWFGWRNVIDLGDITTSRGVEMYLPLWVRVMSAINTPVFNIKIAR